MDVESESDETFLIEVNGEAHLMASGNEFEESGRDLVKEVVLRPKGNILSTHGVLWHVRKISTAGLHEYEIRSSEYPGYQLAVYKEVSEIGEKHILLVSRTSAHFHFIHDQKEYTLITFHFRTTELISRKKETELHYSDLNGEIHKLKLLNRDPTLFAFKCI